MAQFDKSKRSVVKHKTRKPFMGGGGGPSGGTEAGPSEGRPRSSAKGGRGGGGFKVGPRHAPDGAYLGKAKRIKANLIANAKTKQRFYKSIKGKDKADESAMQMDHAEPSLGRFAPEAGARQAREGGQEKEEDTRRSRGRAGPPPPSDDEAEGEDAGAQPPRRRQDRAGPAVPIGGKRRSAVKGSGQSRTDTPSASSADTASQQARQPPKYASREEALAARKERQEKWNKASGSEVGRRRGQPDLGSRMEVLLDKIRAT